MYSLYACATNFLIFYFVLYYSTAQRYGDHTTNLISRNGKKIPLRDFIHNFMINSTIKSVSRARIKQKSSKRSRNEGMGRLSLRSNIYMGILNFWIHLENLPESSIAKQCLQISKQLAENKKQSFVSTIIEILQLIVIL
jgi:hypothetical protein